MTADIFLLQSTSEYDDLYTYAVPEDMENTVRAGVFVDVPFGPSNRTVTGVVRRTGEEKKEGILLKNISGLNADYEPFSEKELDLCDDISKNYICTRGAAAKLIMPPGAEAKGQTVKKARLAISREDAEKLIEGDDLRDIGWIETIRLLLENGQMPVKELLQIKGAKSESFIKTLEKRGYISVCREREEKEQLCAKKETTERSRPLELNEEQRKAFDKIYGLMSDKRFAECLLFGVTSGGKTEVYLQLVQRAIDEGEKVIVLVPEISLTPQMTARFTNRFGGKVAIFHSRLTDTERRREWQKAKNGEVDVVIGARSAVFAPFEKVALYIIDEEQEKTYKSEESPRYQAGEVAVMRAKQDGAVVLYGSATPSIETFYRAEKGEIHYAEILHRATKFGLPTVETVDMRESVREGNTGIFSSRLFGEMKKNIENHEQTIVFVQRRGYSKDMLCEDCGKTMVCAKCRVAMTVHEKIGRLICHYCGNTVKIPEKCPGCGSTRLKRWGVGTERVEEELRSLFPGSSVVRMDMDTTTGREGHEKALRAFGDGKADFLVGTQMIAKGHDFPGVTLVGVVSADSLLNIRSYDAAEKAFQLITQVCGRAGRGDTPGRVIIQAYNLDSYALVSAAAQDYRKFYDTESEIRKLLNYPPYCAMGTVIFYSENDRAAFDRADASFDILCQSARENGIIKTDILGPARCPMPKLKDKYRWRITVKTGTKEELLAILTSFTKKYGKKFGFNKKKGKDDITCHTEV